MGFNQRKLNIGGWFLGATMTDDNANNTVDNVNSNEHDQTIHRYACPVCSIHIPITQKICPKCGTNLASGVDTDKLAEEGGVTASTTPIPQTREGRYKLGSSYFSSEMKLRIELPRQKKFIRLRFTPDKDLILGRLSHEEESPENILDLSTYEAFQLGVSRRHAAIRLRRHALELRDLVSSNGTYVNEQQLAPGEIYRLCSGDVVRLGRLQMILIFEP
ncbi:MAG: FHA domain-containing protein [Chloroflexi bacterium]|nr:MAG: FHA domain-containing protein [Chloroflexota bacterium]